MVKAHPFCATSPSACFLASSKRRCDASLVVSSDFQRFPVELLHGFHWQSIEIPENQWKNIGKSLVTVVFHSLSLIFHWSPMILHVKALFYTLERWSSDVEETAISMDCSARRKVEHQSAIVASSIAQKVWCFYQHLIWNLIQTWSR